MTENTKAMLEKPEFCTVKETAQHLRLCEKQIRRLMHLAVLPDWSAPCIDRYVQHYRAFFPNAEAMNRLWLSQLGRPLALDSLYSLVCRRTRDAFGKRVNPHLFRSCLGTSTAVHHGAEIGLAMTVLDHKSSEVFERHYNQAKMIDAVKAYQQILLADPQDRRKE